MTCDSSNDSSIGFQSRWLALAIAGLLCLTYSTTTIFVRASEGVSHSGSDSTLAVSSHKIKCSHLESVTLVSPEVITPFVANLANHDLDRAQKALEKAFSASGPKLCAPRITTLFPLDGDVVTSRCSVGFMSEADFSNTQRPQKVAAFGCLVCRSLKTPKIWSQRAYGGYAHNPTDGSSQFGLNIHAWKLPVGEYEVGVLLFLQEHSKAPLSFGDSKTHRFRVKASLSPQEFSEKITTLRGQRLPDARYKAAHLEDCLHQVELTDAIWPVINGLTDLEELNLSGLPVSDKMLDNLAPLPYLSSVRLDQTPIQGPALRGLSRLPALTELDISRIWLKNGQLTCVADLPRLRSLRMTHHVLNRDELCAVSKLSELQQLDLSYCVFEDGIPNSTFDEMASLKQLSLAASSIGNTDLREIAKLRSLEKLNLSGTAIGDAGVEHISGHTAVQFLDISKTSVSAHCLKSIATLSQLKMLVVDASLLIEGTIQELKDRGVTVDVLPSSQDEMTRHWANWK